MAGVAAQLKKCLDDMEKHPGQLTSYYAHNQLVGLNPGLEVEGIGHIGMPISERDCELLLKKSTFWPAQKNEVDWRDVKTGETFGQRVRFHHPQWPTISEQIFNAVRSQMGAGKISPGASVDFRFNSLVVYKVGADLVMDDEYMHVSMADVCGTLLIALPCSHDGGDTILRFGGEERVLRTSVTSSWDGSFQAWYCDVPYEELTPLRSGWRVVLRYKMVNTSRAPNPKATLSGHEWDGLRECLAKWSTAFGCKDPAAPQFLLHMLKNRPGTDAPKFSDLEGADLLQYTTLKALMDDTGCRCFLTTVQKTIKGIDECTSEDGEVRWEDGNEYRYFDPYGRSFDTIDSESLNVELVCTALFNSKESDSKQFAVEARNVLNPLDYTERKPDKADFCYDGGGELEHHWRDSAILIMPVGAVTSMFKPREEDLLTMVRLFAAGGSQEPIDIPQAALPSCSAPVSGTATLSLLTVSERNVQSMRVTGQKRGLGADAAAKQHKGKKKKR